MPERAQFALRKPYLNPSNLQTSLFEQTIYQINRIVLFLIDDLGVHLRHLHIGMIKQFRGRVQICAQRQHHCCESIYRKGYY